MEECVSIQILYFREAHCQLIFDFLLTFIRNFTNPRLYTAEHIYIHVPELLR